VCLRKTKFKSKQNFLGDCWQKEREESCRREHQLTSSGGWEEERRSREAKELAILALSLCLKPIHRPSGVTTGARMTAAQLPGVQKSVFPRVDRAQELF